MAKHNQHPPKSPASQPGAPAPEPASAPEPPADLEPDPVVPLETSEPPAAPEAPEPVASPALRCRVNWHFAGFRERDLHEGDEVDTNEAEAAPYLGGVLTRLEAAE